MQLSPFAPLPPQPTQLTFYSSSTPLSAPVWAQGVLAGDFSSSVPKVVLGTQAFDEDCEEIDARSSRVSAADCAAMGAGMAAERFKRLKRLLISANQISDEGAKALGQALSINSCLQVLDLERNQIYFEGAIALGQGLRVNNSLCQLNLKRNELGDEGALALGRGLIVNTGLQVLDLEANGLSDTGAVALSQGLRVNSCLRQLNLSVNHVSDKGAKALGQSLGVNSSLQVLDLSSNRVSDKGVRALGQGLSVNMTLRQLNLSFNRTSFAGVCHIVSCILHNNQLTTVHFDYGPAACIACHSWRHEELVVLPVAVVRRGWTAVLKLMRKFFSVLSLVLSAAAACPIFRPRSLHAHYLQPPLQLVFTLSQRSLERASLQLWCGDSSQRLQLLCCSSPLSILAFRLARAVNRREGSRSFELRAIARILKRCFGGFVWQFWTGIERESTGRSAGLKRCRP